MKLHLDTISGIAFFAGGTRPTLQAGNSLYRSNVACGHVGGSLRDYEAADLYVAYSITDDTGDGRATNPSLDPAAPVAGHCSRPCRRFR